MYGSEEATQVLREMAVEVLGRENMRERGRVNGSREGKGVLEVREEAKGGRERLC